MLNSTSLSIAPSLCRLFNLSIFTGTFPTSWNLGRITPIPKGTNKSLPSCYRPISVLPFASKPFERHVKAAVEKFLQVISSSQWGFMSNQSTVSVLIKVLDEWQWALDQDSEVCVAFSWCVQSIWQCVSITTAQKIEWDWSALSHKVDQKLSSRQVSTSAKWLHLARWTALPFLH